MSSTELRIADGVATLALDRADVHNAFNAELIAELVCRLRELAVDPQVQFLVLAGNGRSFSAGADLHWMRAMAAASEADNYADACRLAELMRTLAFFPKPTLARVQGAAYGGGVGLIACCDIAISVSEAKFGLTESKLGLAPAVISPYVIGAIGARQALRLFLTAAVFDAPTARDLGLLHAVVPAHELDETLAREVRLLRRAGPAAMRACKQLVARVGGREEASQRTLDEENARLIARLRVSAEGQEGLCAFLGKRDPVWSMVPA